MLVPLWKLKPANRGAIDPLADCPRKDRQISPDGRWVVYTSDESAMFEVYVQPPPEAGAKWQVSTGWGYTPRWGHDGSELFHVAANRDLVVAPVQTAGAAPTFGASQKLFRMPGPMVAAFFADYDVFPDGKHFVANTPAPSADGSVIRVISNWTAVH